MKALLPGSTVGVVGGGQLGRYFVLEARRLGFHTWVLDPDAAAPAMQLAENILVAAYDNADALDTLATACDAVTIEFENVPASSLERLARNTRVAPSSHSIRIAQDRQLEKQQASLHGLDPVPYAPISTSADIPAAMVNVGLPAILKTARLGYDGKGQSLCQTALEVEQAFNALDGAFCILERRIELAAEVSVVLARGFDGAIAVFPIAQNVHSGGILATSLVPAQVDPQVLSTAHRLAVQLAEGLDYHGVLAVEFFIDQKGRVLFNEMAPRPHNSGHYTLDAAVCSQFEQQLRALCAIPLGSTALLSPVCMLNVMGDAWQGSGGAESSPDWASVMNLPGASLHLYGKAMARAGRKMGHINCLADSAQAALEHAHELQRSLAR